MTVFIVLSIVLLSIPIACIIFALVSKARQSKHIQTINNAPTTTTTMRKSVKGRTVFETTTNQPPRPQRSPVLPYTNQEVAKQPRPKSLKSAWQRLSRPFSIVPEPREGDQIEMTKQSPMPYKTNFSEQIDDGSFSPVSRTNILEHMRSPVSPLSITNMPATSSVTGRILYGYKHESQSQAGPFINISLTPPTKCKISPAGIGLRAARAYVPPITFDSIQTEQVIKDFAKAKGKEFAKQAEHYAAEDTKSRILDANDQKHTEVHLAKPPKCKASAKDGESAGSM